MNASDWPPLTDPLLLSRDVVHVVRVELQADERKLDEFRSVLSPDELNRADRYKIDRPRRHFIICRAILRQLLGSSVARPPSAIEFEYGPHGKPSLRRSSGASMHVEFSVSHSADLALIAMASGRRVGVDLERVDPAVRILKLAARFFSPRETAELSALPESDQLASFYRGWTCKEAYLKATGAGLSFSLSNFTVSMDPRGSAALLEVANQPEELDRWRMLSLAAGPEFAAAILLEAKRHEAVVVRQWSV